MLHLYEFITLSGCWGRKSFMICYKSMFTKNAIFEKKIMKEKSESRPVSHLQESTVVLIITQWLQHRAARLFF